MTIENGVDTDRFSPAVLSGSERDAYEIPSRALVVGSVGRLEPVKAYDRLLRAVATVCARNELALPVYVLLCGDGSQRLALEQLAASLGLGDRVRFPGWVTDPVDAYRCMDVFVLPSISEGLSVSLLEAMATGVVPIVTPVGANVDVLNGSLAGQVVPGEDPGRIAAVLGQTLASADRRRSLSTTARATVVERFSQARMIEAYTALYERLLHRSQGASA